MVGFAALLSCGCVERLLQVRSDPSNATVHVNGVEVGTTPLSHPFTFYGTVDVTVRKDEHFSHRRLVALRPPWYQVFPLDFVTELLVPWTLRDVHEVEVRMDPVASGSTGETRRELDAIRARAAALKQSFEGGAREAMESGDAQEKGSLVQPRN